MATRAAASKKQPAPVEVPKPTLISPPDVAALQVQLKDLGALPLARITSDEECLTLSTYVARAHTFVQTVNAVFEDCTSLAFKLHRTLTGLRGTLTAVPENHIAIGKRLLIDWDNEKRRQAAAARQRELDEAAARQKQQEEQFAAEAAARESSMEELFPWEMPEESAPEPVFIPEVIPVPATMNVSAPLASGHFKNNPWKASVALKDLVLACADKIKRGDESLLEYLLVNETALNKAARELGEEISVAIDPCITAVRERTVSM